jgi:hypothetical protein
MANLGHIGAIIVARQWGEEMGLILCRDGDFSSPLELYLLHSPINHDN